MNLSICLIALAATLTFGPAGASLSAKPDTGSREVFDRRIAPILKSAKPSSCSECHLSGVDLKDYVRATESETFAALRDGGMIDVNRPEESHLLALIRKSRPKTPLLTAEARTAEYEAFRTWILAAAANPMLVSLPKAARPARALVDNSVLRHARIDTVLASFERNIWSQQGRCMNCHTPGTPENTENAKKFGDRVKWFAPDSPEETMNRILAQNLVNLDKPEESLLLLKPLNRVQHGGGVKFLYGDAGYKQFRAWLDDYAASVKGTYRVAADLPAESTGSLVYTTSILTVTDTPDSWGDKLLSVDIFAWDPAKSSWSEKPIATGDRGVWAKGHSTNILVFLTVPRVSPTERATRRDPRLVPGKYLLKYYCDTSGALNRDFRMPTNSPAFYQGRQVISSDWPTGWSNPTRVSVKLETP